MNENADILFERCSNFNAAICKFWLPGLILLEADKEVKFYTPDHRQEMFSFKKDENYQFTFNAEDVQRYKWIENDEEIKNTLVRYNIPDLRLPVLDNRTQEKYYTRNSKTGRWGKGAAFFFFPHYHFEIFSVFELYADYAYFNRCLKRIEKIDCPDDEWYERRMIEFEQILIIAHQNANIDYDGNPIYRVPFEEKEKTFKRTVESWFRYRLSENKYTSGFRCKNYRFGPSWRKWG